MKHGWSKMMFGAVVWILVSWFGILEVSAAEPVKVVWQVPGCIYPVLGWRMPVCLSDSDWRVDRAVAALAPTNYNCHFYTRLHLVERTQPSQMSRWVKQPSADVITTEFLLRAGLRKREPGESAQAGDVVVAGRSDAWGGTAYTHSAVVREVDDAGVIRSIRQKFDEARPVVDVALDEFRMLYAGMHPYRMEVWSWSLGAPHQVASR